MERRWLGEMLERKRFKFNFTMNEMGYDFMLDSIPYYVFIPLLASPFLCPLNIVFTSNSHYTRVSMIESIFTLLRNEMSFTQRLIWTIYFYCLVPRAVWK